MWLPCPECRIESPFERPPCQDGHGEECPEWACVTCGYAVFAGEAQIGWLPDAPAEQDSSKQSPERRHSTRPHAA